MSDADQPPREWRFYIADMIEFAEKVLAYTKDVDQDTLVADPLRYDAVLRNLELIGRSRDAYPRSRAGRASGHSVASDCGTSQPLGARLPDHQRPRGLDDDSGSRSAPRAVSAKRFERGHRRPRIEMAKRKQARTASESLHSDISRPFDRPESCRIAVKVINHIGDEVMKVFRV